MSRPAQRSEPESTPANSQSAAMMSGSVRRDRIARGPSPMLLMFTTGRIYSSSAFLYGMRTCHKVNGPAWAAGITRSLAANFHWVGQRESVITCPTPAWRMVSRWSSPMRW